MQPAIRFSVIGINHAHIDGQVNLLLRAGAELVSVFAEEADLIAKFLQKFPQAKQARQIEEILEDQTIHMIITAAIPNQRAPLGVRVMQHGKDFMTDKPGVTTLEQLADVRRVQADTGRIYSVCFSERFESAATEKAGR